MEIFKAAAAHFQQHDIELIWFAIYLVLFFFSTTFSFSKNIQTFIKKLKARDNTVETSRSCSDNLKRIIHYISSSFFVCVSE